MLDLTTPALGRVRRAAGVVGSITLAHVASACAGPPRLLEGGLHEPVPPPSIMPGPDWIATLDRAQPRWATAPTSWSDAMFTGNGRLGTTVFTRGANEVVIELGDTEAVASIGHHPLLLFPPRVLIGRLVIRTLGERVDFDGRLDLWNAEAVMRIVTDRGALSIRHYTHSGERTIVTELRTEGDESAAVVSFEPDAPVSPAIGAFGGSVPQMMVPAPPEVSEADGLHRIIQPLPLAQGQHATLWSDHLVGPDHRLLLATFEPRRLRFDAATIAEARLRSAAERGPGVLEAEHRTWWHRYWPAGWISLPDQRVESFYWMQMYKHASATRSDGVVLDNQGPWLQSSGWPDAHWNLNVQLNYSSMVTANRIDQMRSLCDSLWTYRDHLEANAGPFVSRRYGPTYHIGRTSSWDLLAIGGMLPFADFELGNLTWAIAKCWDVYEVTGDEAFLRDRLVPLLRGAVNMYLATMTIREDGSVFFPTTRSPEYPLGQAVTGWQPNANYALQTFAWGLDRLIWAEEHLGADDPLAPLWRRTRQRIRFPQDDNGLLVAEGVPLAVSHRHFSHLLGIDELDLFDPEDQVDRDLIERSLRHWIEVGESGSDFLAYARMYAGRVEALLGNGDAALDQIQRALQIFRPNTFYAEPWPTAVNPVIETPLATAEAIHRLLIQPRHGRLGVFTSTPSQWPDAAFHDLAVPGGFLVSGRRTEGTTRWLRLAARTGGRLRVLTDLADGFQVRTDSNAATVERTAAGELIFDIPAGEEVVVWTGAEAPRIEAVAVTKPGVWGLRD